MKSKKRIIIVLTVVVVIGLILLILSRIAQGTADISAQPLKASVQNPGIRIAVAGVDLADSDQAREPRNSWPAEIVSSEVSVVQPQREGVLTAWNVRVGDMVQKGDVIGTISAPPATPELVQMLAEQMESSKAAQAKAQAARDYISGSSSSTATSLGSLRENERARERALRSFLERTVSSHVTLVTYFQNWRDMKYGSFSLPYGSYNQLLRSDYEEALARLVEAMKASTLPPIAESEPYFDVATKLVWGSVTEGSAYKFNVAAKDDQKEFYTMLSDYREAQAEARDKEAEYSQMIREADAATAAYETVSEQITSGVSIRAPRAGTLSAIYGRVGDLVKPDMAIALISDAGSGKLTVRMHIPSNVRKPRAGEIVSVTRPGFSSDVQKARIVGTGSSLDSTGSYMADAEFIETTEWPVGASVRVAAPQSSQPVLIQASALWWSKEGIPHIWAISPADRIFSKNIKIGRTLGSLVEVYEGLKTGDRYIAVPTSSLHEDALVSDITGPDATSASAGSKDQKPASSSGHSGHGSHGSMPGMEM